MTFEDVFFTVIAAILMALAIFEYTRNNHASAAFAVSAANTMLIAMILVKL